MTEQQAKKPADDGARSVPPKSSSSNKTLIIVLAIVAILVVLPAIAFGVGVFWLSRGDNANNLTESLIESSTGTSDVEIDNNGETVKIETDEGSFSVGENQELPKDLPDVVVIYDNQTVKSTITDDNADDGSVSWTFVAETSDATDKVGEFFEQKFVEKGWAVESTSSYGDISTYSFTKDDLKATITLSPAYGDEGKINISYYITKGE